MATAIKVNQQMIARKLHVSVATVSKALSNSVGVSQDTRTKILRAAEELGYLDAKMRREGEKIRPKTKHHFIGALVRGSYQANNGQLPAQYFEGIRELMSDLNVTLVPQEVLGSEDDHAILDPQFQAPALRNGSLSGILLMGEWSADVVRELQKLAPCISMPFTINGVELDQIGLDHNDAMCNIVQHLHDLGHRRIGFFGRCHSLSWSTERFAGYINALSRLQLDFMPDDVVGMAESPLMEEGHDTAWARYTQQAIAATSDGVTAWVCSSDWPGNQLHKAMVDAGLRVPTDVSLVGFDDTEPITLGMPPLTTTRLPRGEIGRAAVVRMVERINDPEIENNRIQFICPLVDHGTTAKPGSGQKVAPASQPSQDKEEEEKLRSEIC